MSLVFACAPDPLVSSTLRAADPVVARPCRADVYYAEVADNWGVPSWNNDFLSGTTGLIDEMSGLANDTGKPWFCGDGEITCPSGQVIVSIAPVLAPRTTPSYRADAHLRFYRMYFTDALTGERLTTRREAMCSVVSEFRSRFLARLGPRDHLNFGRECDVAAQGWEGDPSDEMKNWHLERMGLSPALVNLLPVPPTQQLADVALIDSGVERNIAFGMGLASELDLAGGAGLHRHGSGMALLIKQVAPAASIHSYRVMNRDGAGVGATVTQALDHALFDLSPTSPTRPLIINLSLGWPTELAAPAVLKGPGCSTWEDSYGESVRFMLRTARLIDLSNGPERRPVLLVAAAGNQPLPAPADMFPAPPANPPSTLPCPNQAPLPEQSWFYPAQWNREVSCGNNLESVETAVGISIVDDRDLPSAIGMPNAESRLVAPGQHVFTTHPNATMTDTEPTCGLSPPDRVTMPTVFSGTSVGAALVSAAAARAQAIRLERSEPALSWKGLSDLLYLTGDALCTYDDEARKTASSGVDDVEVRRLSVARLERALFEPGCADLITCASSTVAVVNVLHDCKEELVDCGLEEYDAYGDLAVDCVDYEPVAPPKTDDVTWCPPPGTGTSTHATVELPACQEYPEICFGTDPPRPFLGSLGPQPTDGGCLQCGVLVTHNSPTAKLVVQLNPDLSPASTFIKKYVRYTGPNCHYSGCPEMTHKTALDSPNTDTLWVAGGSFTMMFSVAPQMDWSKTTVELQMTINPNNGSAPGVDVSSLWVAE